MYQLVPNLHERMEFSACYLEARLDQGATSFDKTNEVIGNVAGRLFLHIVQIAWRDLFAAISRIPFKSSEYEERASE